MKILVISDGGPSDTQEVVREKKEEKHEIVTAQL
jgi:hypothetical protein